MAQLFATREAVRWALGWSSLYILSAFNTIDLASGLAGQTFYRNWHMAPVWLLYVLLALSTAATVLTQQYLMEIVEDLGHAYRSLHSGQITIPLTLTGKYHP